MFYHDNKGVYLMAGATPVENINDIKVPTDCKKFYAVKVGTVPGVYYYWDDCKAAVAGVSKAVYKSFKTLSEALEFVTGECVPTKKEAVAEASGRPYAYVDGSFNPKEKIYGYGVYLHTGKESFEFSGSGNAEDMVSMRNVSGEILGSMRAIDEAIKLGLTELDIYYDYQGIESWATGAWKRNKSGTIEYHNFIQSVKNKIKINFVKVAAHTGVELNEKVDKLAKAAVGVK